MEYGCFWCQLESGCRIFANISCVKLPIVQQLSMAACPPKPTDRILLVYLYDFYELNKNVCEESIDNVTQI